jgi:hypothetical protein
MAKVHEQTQLTACRAEVVQNLSAVFIDQLGDCFDLKDDFVVANEIWIEFLKQSATAVLQGLRWLRQKWTSLKFQLDLRAIVIDRLEKPAALMFVNLEAYANDGVTFFLINQFCFFFSCHFAFFVGWTLRSGKRRSKRRQLRLARTEMRTLADFQPGSAAAAPRLPRFRGCCHRLRQCQ